MKIKIAAVVILAIAFSSCSSVYIKPTIQATLFTQKIPGPAALLFRAAQQILPSLGYKIQGSDPEAGTITTAPVDVTIQQDECDCGSNLGLPIINSRGKKATVSFIIGVAANELTVRAEIVPVLSDLLSSLGAAGEIACVSKGILEKRLAKNFAEKMAGNAIKMLFKNGF